MFCVECGKEKTLYKQGLCLDCYIKNTTFSSGPDILDIILCSRCNAIKYKNTWLTTSFTQAVERIVRDKFNFSKELTKTTISVDCKKGDQTLTCIVHVQENVQDVTIHEDHEVLLRLKYTTCDICSKQTGGYYEATLQVRAENRQLTNDEKTKVQQEIEEQISMSQQKGNDNNFITDIAEEHGGLDFYLSDKGAAFTIAKRLLENHGGQLKQSSTNVGMKDGKQLYRMTYLIRFPEYQPDSILRLHQHYYLVISISGQKIQLIDLNTLEKTSKKIKEVQNATVLGDVAHFLKTMIVVSQTAQEVQLMDQATYKIVQVKKNDTKKITKETISVLQVDDDIFLLPSDYQNQ